MKLFFWLSKRIISKASGSLGIDSDSIMFDNWWIKKQTIKCNAHWDFLYYCIQAPLLIHAKEAVWQNGQRVGLAIERPELNILARPGLKIMVGRWPDTLTSQKNFGKISAQVTVVSSLTKSPPRSWLAANQLAIKKSNRHQDKTLQ